MELPSSLKGMLGEKEVENIVNTLSKIYDIKYLSNVILPYNNGITQIDLVIFSTRIFLCLEVKAWEGVITIPNNISNNWKIAYDKKIINIFSPVDQNLRHTNALNLNSINGVRYLNYIVFPTNPVMINKHGCIGNMSDLINLISIQSEVYSRDIVKSEYAKIKEISDSYFQEYVIRELGRSMNTELNTNYFKD